MYRMLNDNRLPFFPEYPKKVTYVDRENALYRRIQGETFPKPRHGSKELGNIVMKSCQYQKEDRYGSIFQMKEALEHLNGNTSKNLNRIYGMTDAKKRQVRQREEGTVGLFEQNFEKRKCEGTEKLRKKKATGREEGYYRTGHRKRTDADSKEKESGVVICADRCLSSRIFRCDDSSIYQNKKYCSNEKYRKRTDANRGKQQ